MSITAKIIRFPFQVVGWMMMALFVMMIYSEGKKQIKGFLND
jgi:hypothetical protein